MKVVKQQPGVSRRFIAEEKISGPYFNLIVVEAKPEVNVGRLTIGRGPRSGSGKGDEVPTVARWAEVDHNSHQGPCQEGHCLVILAKPKMLKYLNAAHILAVADMGGVKAAKAHAHNGATVRIWQTECLFSASAVRIRKIALTIGIRASLVSTLVVASIVYIFNMRQAGIQQVLQN